MVPNEDEGGTMTESEGRPRESRYYASSQVPITLKILKSSYTHTRPPSLLNFQHGDPSYGLSLS